ncbi:phage-related minor tail protein [Elysia marginata]|uniref:Phage-related minor tail protein n=1 Tax=Elysia marginata TaxID=1093978 RepID=A0AAV4GZE6_9GAST|nr:phage-related minor tail protein [Elysia marginata]
MKAPKETIGLFKRVSASLKEMVKGMGAFKEVSEGAKKTAIKFGKETSSQFAKTGKKIKVLPHSIEELNEKLQKLKTLKNKSFSVEAIKRYEDKIKDTEKEIERLGRTAKSSGGFLESMVNVTRLNQMMEVADKLVEKFSFAEDLATLRTNLQISTELDDEGLEDALSKIHALSKVYNENGEDIRRSANTLSKEMGISFSDTLGLIQKGFQTGANLNGDFLDQLKEYPAQMQEAGLSANEMIALISQSGKAGIYSDKALDSIKEAGLSLREMGKAQEDALKGIGLKPEDLVGKSSFDAIRLISEQMKGASTQAKQLVLADIFKGAGEDAGRGFIEGLADQNLDLATMEAFEKPGDTIKTTVANIESWISSAMGGIGDSIISSLPVISNIGVTLMGVMPLIEKFRMGMKLSAIATNVMTVAQGALNFVMNLNPIFLVVTAVVALGAAVVWAYNKFDWFRGAVQGSWEMLKELGSIIWDHVVESFKKLLAGITGIGSALVSFFSGDWEEAWETGKAAVKDLAGAYVGSTVGLVSDVAKNGEKLGKALKRGYNNGFGELATPKVAEEEKGIVPSDMSKQISNNGIPSSIQLNPAIAEQASAKAGNTRVQMTLNFNINQTFAEGKAKMNELGNQVAEILSEVAREKALAL